MGIFDRFKKDEVPKPVDQTPGTEPQTKGRRDVDVEKLAKEVQMAARASIQATAARAVLAPSTYVERAETRRTHKNTGDKHSAQMVTNAILEHDPKFQKTPESMKEDLKDLIFDLITAARKAPDTFYPKLSEKRRLLAGNKDVLDLFLITLSTWLMGENFKYDQKKPFRPGQTEGLPVWTVVVCRHNDLFFDKPKVTVRSNSGPTEQIELLYVFNGLIRI